MLATSSPLSLSPLATKSSQTRSSKMKNSREGSSSSLCQAIDLVAQVKETHGLGPQDLFKLLKDSENLSFMRMTENGSFLQIDVEKLAKLLPLHLIAVVLSSQRDEVLLSYLLRGLRLLHSLCEIASRFPKIEQILLDDAKMSEQLLDLVFYLLIVFSEYRQENHIAGHLLLYSTAVACSMYLLTACISTHWNELAYVLLAHPKVDIFMDTSFRSVYRNISSLRISLSSQQNECCANSSSVVEPSVTHLCVQCEASLQFLQSLCQQKPFRERLLRNKELCGKGGILQLAVTILKLNTPRFDDCPAIVAAVCRIKARALSILLQLCETDSVSFLDEVAGVPGSLHLAKSVAFEVIAVLKNMAGKGHIQHSSHSGKTYPTGLLQLNALRLADVFSDDSNFRSYITAYFAEVLAIILALPYQEFLSYWCSSYLPTKEVDATLIYDPFAASGWTINSLLSLDMTNVEYSESTFQPTNVPQAYAHQRTSLLVKIIANLHCFIPKICEEQERNFFLHKFLESLQMQFPNSGTGFASVADAKIAATVSKNLRLLLGHTESLIPAYLNDEDVQLFRVFYTQLRSLVGPSDIEVNRAQEDQCGRACSLGNVDLDHKSRNGNLREGMSENSAFPDLDNSYARSDQVDEADIITPDDGRIYNSRCTKATSRCGSPEIDKDFHNVETSGSDSSSTRGKISFQHAHNGNNPKLCALPGEGIVGGTYEEDKVATVHRDGNQSRKRKRTIMNEKQISMIEKALQEEPDMQKNAASLKAWAERLCSHGPDITSSQIKNWLNNRKARLARLAKDSRPVPEAEKSSPVNQDPEKSHDYSQQTKGDNDEQKKLPVCERTNPGGPSTARPQVENVDLQLEPGQHVLLIDDQGVQIARARVHQVKDKWDGINLEETKTCVVDIIEYFPERYLGVVHPTPPQVGGSGGGPSFEDNDVTMGRTRVLWESSRILMPQPRPAPN